jgi:hypothetical protein
MNAFSFAVVLIVISIFGVYSQASPQLLQKMIEESPAVEKTTNTLFESVLEKFLSEGAQKAVPMGPSSLTASFLGTGMVPA